MVRCDRSSPINPSGTLDLGLGFGRQPSGSVFLEKLTPRFNAVWEESTGQERTGSVFEGIECQLTERMVVDLSAQPFSVVDGPPDHQVVLGYRLLWANPGDSIIKAG